MKKEIPRLSPFSRFLAYLTAALYALTGAVLFVLPQAMSAQFAWKVSQFVTMTIGARPQITVEHSTE